MTTIFDIPGTNPSNPFSPLIQQAFHAGAPKPKGFSAPAVQIVQKVTTSPDPATAFWSLWDAFFVAIATSTPRPPTAHIDAFTSQLALLDALRARPPTTPTNVAAGSNAELKLRTTYLDNTSGTIPWPSLPGFASQWRDTHDILEAWRDWDGIRQNPQKGERTSSSGTPTTTPTTTPTETDAPAVLNHARHEPARYFLRFVDFSVALLRREQEQRRRQHGEAAAAAAAGCWPGPLPLTQRKGHCIPPEQVWALDARVMATWMQGGAGVLWEADREGGLRVDYAVALDEETDRWLRRDGLTRERWVLWGRRLRELLVGGEGEGWLDEETRVVVEEAAEVIEGLLRGK